MASTIATCGHVIDTSWAIRGIVSAKAFTPERQRAVWFGVMCPRCLQETEQMGLILPDQSACDEWLGLADNVEQSDGESSRPPTHKTHLPPPDQSVYDLGGEGDDGRETAYGCWFLLVISLCAIVSIIAFRLGAMFGK